MILALLLLIFMYNSSVLVNLVFLLVDNVYEQIVRCTRA